MNPSLLNKPYVGTIALSSVLRWSIFMVLWLLVPELHAQKEIANLGTLKLSEKKFNRITICQNGLMAVSYGSKEQRNFRLYDKNGAFLFSHILKKEQGTAVLAPLHIQETDSTLVYYFPGKMPKYTLEMVTVWKNQDQIKTRDFRFNKAKDFLRIGIVAPDGLIAIIQGKKSKQLQYVKVNPDGEQERGLLETNYAETGSLLWRNKYYTQIVSEGPQPMLGLSGACKVYTRGNDRFLITMDPMRKEDNGMIRMFNLDLQAKTLTYSRLFNQVDQGFKNIRSFVYQDHLYRLTVKYGFLDLGIFQLSDFEQVQHLRSDRGSVFDLNNSAVILAGQGSYLNQMRLGQEKETRHVIQGMDKMRLILDVYPVKDQLAIKVGSYGEFMYGQFSPNMGTLDPYGSAFNFELLGREKLYKKISFNGFISLLQNETLERDSKPASFDTRDLKIWDFVGDNYKDYWHLDIVDMPETGRCLVAEEHKTGEIVILEFGGF